MKPLYISVAALLMTSPAYAKDRPGPDPERMHDHMFQMIDADKDGFITKQEHETFHNQNFTEADANGDEKVGLEESRMHKRKKMQALREQRGKAK